VNRSRTFKNIVELGKRRDLVELVKTVRYLLLGGGRREALARVASMIRHRAVPRAPVVQQRRRYPPWTSTP
jgi:hypothetical protein